MKKSIMRATLPTPPGQTLVKQLDLLKKSGFDGIQLGVQPAGWIPGGWGNDSGFQFQKDIDDAPIYQANMTEFLQQANLVESGN